MLASRRSVVAPATIVEKARRDLREYSVQEMSRMFTAGFFWRYFANDVRFRVREASEVAERMNGVKLT